MQEMQVHPLGQEDPLERSGRSPGEVRKIPGVRKIPWRGPEDPLERSGRSPREGNGNPLQYSGLENPTDRGAWRAVVHGATESRT